MVTSATPNVSGDSNIISKSTTKDKGPTAAKGSDYSKVQQTGVSRSTQKDTGNTDNYGEYEDWVELYNPMACFLP